MTLPLGQAVIFTAMSKLPASAKYLRIGQLAAKSGVSAKALRLYEVRGLLAPDAHSDGGYRLYGAPALARLNEIGVLKRAGFTLAEIGKLLQRRGSAAALIEARIVALRREVHSKSQALAALERAWRGLDSTSNDIDQLLENIRMSEKLDVRFSEAERAQYKRHGEILGQHFTPEEREQLLRRAEQLGEDGMRQAQNEWPELIKQVRSAMNLGIPPTDPSVMEMGRRWYRLIQAFTGGDANLGRKMKQAYDREPQVMAAQGMDAAMFAYIREAMQAAGLKLSA
ncbi:MAG: MerR family transcriptional regulator [Rhodanobacteraceae bacterium]|nr:MAG: MerR family transcriptional regulator [Rhodanobacteraceae bacterium]